MKKRYSFAVITTLLLSFTLIPSFAQAKLYVNIGAGPEAKLAQAQPFYIRNHKDQTSCFYSANNGYMGLSGNGCQFDNIDDVPEELTIEYVRWLPDNEAEAKYYGHSSYTPGELDTHYYNLQGQEVSEEQWMQAGAAKVQQALAQLPESAWQSYTFYPKQIANKYEDKNPEGKPTGVVIPFGISGVVFPSLFPSSKPRELNITIVMNDDGTITQEEDFNWLSKYTSSDAYQSTMD